MTEEELLNYIKTNKNELLDINSKLYDDLDIELLINLIEKQQKEIELLNIQLKSQKGLSYFIHKNIVESDYISKDKIRDLQMQREFELQQQYIDFVYDKEWQIYNKLLKER